MGQLLLKLWEFLAWRLWSPLVLEVHRLTFEDVSGRSANSILVVTPHPRRYAAEVTVTNRSGRAIHIRSIALSCPGGTSMNAWVPTPLRLEPHEFRKHNLVFPLGDNEQPVTGEFKLEVSPSVGMKSVVMVTFK